MRDNFDTLRQVLARFRLEDISQEKITRLRGGLSGSDVWQVESPWGKFCLKCMPSGFSVQRIRTIHQAVSLRRDAGMTCLAGYCQAASGETFVVHDERIWELQLWAKGDAPTPPFSNWQKTKMYQAVARFHTVLRDTPHDQSQLGKSEGVAVRLNMLRTWRDHRMEEIRPRIVNYGHPQRKADLSFLAVSFQEYQHKLEPLLVEVSQQDYLLEHCIGDPRPENFRFTGDQLTGLIDLGSLRRDNIALDISRLASELASEAPIDWKLAWDSISAIHPLKEPEKRLTIVLDAANVILTGLKWIQWLVVDGYSFESEALVDSRLCHLCQRFQQIKQHPVWQ
ncbi:hypothetical protein DTL42_04545 [Bremerella cremea]|uniref:Aminoglycoside phosphotransferase domain-containing protein n=1 Tax=Bremerella cremea TaxID=1031537 RepID=A0A368KVI1_9BACT|nr:phosphotransferase [Bremerella cremea]RCS54418.1 hypothetical protein DTL42_04545 [Bremerella cremea]